MPRAYSTFYPGADRDAALVEGIRWAVANAVDRRNAKQDSLPTGEPVLCVLDGYPVANHPLLAGRVLVDDPDAVTIQATPGARRTPGRDRGSDRRGDDPSPSGASGIEVGQQGLGELLVVLEDAAVTGVRVDHQRAAGDPAVHVL